MPEVNLKYQLPEEQEEFNVALQACNYLCALNEIREIVRKYNKYGHEFKSADEAISTIYDKIHEVINYNNITF